MNGIWKDGLKVKTKTQNIKAEEYAVFTYACLHAKMKAETQ